MADSKNILANLKYRADSPFGLTVGGITGLLTGSIPGEEKPFSIRAFSGGSRGHTGIQKGKEAQFHKNAKSYLYHESNSLSSYSSSTSERKDRHGNYTQRGGTLPNGRYQCIFAHKKSLGGDVIRLDPGPGVLHQWSAFYRTPIVMRDGGFYIHGQGAKGSDGCIVPRSPEERKRLTYAIKRFTEAGGKVYLQVSGALVILPAELESMLA